MTLISSSTRIALKNAIAVELHVIRARDAQIEQASEVLARARSERAAAQRHLEDLERDLAALTPTPRVLASVPAPKEA